MRKNGLNQPRITYGQLNRVLASLGFVRKKTAEFTAYREANHDAIIVLPAMSDKALVSEPHLVAVNNTVTGKGVTTTEALYSLLVPESHVLLPSWLDRVPSVDFAPEKELLAQFETWAQENGWIVSDGSNLPLELQQQTDVLLEQPDHNRSIRLAVRRKSRNDDGVIRVDACASWVLTLAPGQAAMTMASSA